MDWQEYLLPKSDKIGLNSTRTIFFWSKTLGSLVPITNVRISNQFIGSL